MASAEQPLKKRKMHEPPSPPPSEQPTPPPPPQTPNSHHLQSSVAPPTPPPLSQEEILRRHRSKEEIRKFFEFYKRIKYQNDKRLMPDLEQAYLTLINAAYRGDASIHRLVAEYIPRYASYCPTALEAATKVVINMHTLCFTMTSGGEDGDAVAFETAKTCILGLVDVCQTAASVDPTSAVIQGICSAVFRDVYSFFISLFEGQDIFEIIDERVLQIHDVTESFSELKQQFLEEDNSASVKLSKLRVLSFLKIFLSCPKNSIAACFDLVDSPGTEGMQKGNYFLRQLTRELNDICSHHLDGAKSSRVFTETKSEDKHVVGNGPPSPASKSCLLQLVLDKDPSIKSLIFSRYNKLCKSASSEVVSDITCILEGVIESFAQQIKANDSVDGGVDISNPPKYFAQYLLPRVPNQQGTSSVASGRDCQDKLSGIYLNTKGTDPIDEGESKSMNFQSGESGDLSSSRTFMPRDLLNWHSFSPRTRTPLDFRSNSFNGISNSLQVEKSESPNLNPSLLTIRSLAGPANSSFESSKHNPPPAHPSASHVTWYSDGDPASMAIFPASEQLWLGSLGPDASEVLIRAQFEKFGPINELQYFPFKGFAFVKYRNIMDALKAREVMQGHSPWGDCLVKFLDIGLGTKGAIYGVAIGSSCHVYVGNVLSKQAKDEMVHEVKKVLHKGPRLVTDLNSEGALLMEFDSPEEATVSMVHMRWHRKGNNNFILPSSNVGPTNVLMHTEGAGPNSAPTHDMINCYSSTSMIESPHTQRNLEKPSDSYMKRTSGLSSLLFQLRAKYNITHPQGSENLRPGASMSDHEQVPSNMLSINIPNISPTYLTDDELLAVCNFAIHQMGYVVRLSRTNMPMGAHWSVECNSVDAANTLLRNLRDCPGIFFHIEFSHCERHHFAPPIRPDNYAPELTSQKTNQEIHGPGMQTAEFQSNWTSVSHAGMLEVGRAGATEKRWAYGKPENIPLGQVSFASRPLQTPGTSIVPHQPLHGSANEQPVYLHPNNLWYARGLNHHQPSTSNPIPSAHVNPPAPPFLPASVTPLSQIQGCSTPQFNSMLPLNGVPPPLSSLAPSPFNMPPSLPYLPNLQPPLPQIDFQPPLPPSPSPSPSPPPPPHSRPPVLPPPPSSPPPPSESANIECSTSSLHYPWQGILSKSGVHYCTTYAQRVDSDICNYSNTIAEPLGWPAKLDMTKRTDFRHVKSTFSITPPHKFQDFIAYLKQRDCAGVIKIPAAESVWARLLFILPYSQDTCSMLSIPPNPSLCLIGLVLPKEMNSEAV